MEIWKSETSSWDAPHRSYSIATEFIHFVAHVFCAAVEKAWLASTPCPSIVPDIIWLMIENLEVTRLSSRMLGCSFLFLFPWKVIGENDDNARLVNVTTATHKKERWETFQHQTKVSPRGMSPQSLRVATAFLNRQLHVHTFEWVCRFKFTGSRATSSQFSYEYRRWP